MSDYRTDWLAERRRRVQSTDAPALCRLAPETWHVCTPLHVYHDKLGTLPAQAETAPLKSGRLLEGVVAAMYEEETGRALNDPQGKIMVDPARDWMGATVDRFAADNSRIVELKTTRFMERGEDGWGEPGTDQVPPHYLVQVQHQMAVTGHRLADVAVLVGGQELRVYTVERSAEFVERLVWIEAEFWKLVVRREEPPPDWEHPATPALIDQIRRPVPGKVIDLEPAQAVVACRYRDLGREISQLEKQREEYRGVLLKLIGDAETAECPANGMTPAVRVVRKIVKQNRPATPARTIEYPTLTVKEPK
jgi:putative phage-type endonuclease